VVLTGRFGVRSSATASKAGRKVPVLDSMREISVLSVLIRCRSKPPFPFAAAVLTSNRQ
jgi:hypothetical protein